MNATANYRIARYGTQHGKPRLEEFDEPPTKIDNPPDEVEVIYEAGYTPTPPAALKTAMLQLIADWAAFQGSAEELIAGRLAKNLPGDYKQTLMAAGYPIYGV